MARFIRYKIRAIQIACEGEVAFLQFLVPRWYVRGSGFKVTRQDLGGGGLKTILVKAKKSFMGHDATFLFLDQRTIDAAPGISIPKSIELLVSDPCLEAMICRILGSDKTFEGVSEQDCKKYLRDTYGCDAITKEWLEGCITDEMLKKGVKNIPCLGKIEQILKEGRLRR